MGFGLLFIGYALTFLMSFNSYGFLFRLMGCVIIAQSLSKLKDFEPSFSLASVSSVFMMLLALAESVLSILSWSYDLSLAVSVLQTVFYISAIPLHFLLYRSIGRLASSLDLGDIRLKCARYGVFIGIEIILIAVTMLVWYLKYPFARYLLMASFILPFILFFMNLALIYSCYKNICEEGCEDVARKPSRIPFLNKLYEAQDKREQEIFEKTKSYAENKIRQDNEKKKNKRKKKK